MNMRALLTTLTLTLPLTLGLLNAADGDSNVSDLNNEFIVSDSAGDFDEVVKCKNFTNIKGHADFLGNAKIQNGIFADQELRYNEQELVWAYNFCKDEHNGIYGGVGFANYYLGWQDNPFFYRRNFPTINFILGGFTSYFKSWFWQGGAVVNVDANNTDLGDYAMYTVLAWGRYAYCKTLGLHIGVLGWTGIRQTWVLPVLGLDYKFCDTWSINLIFPINVSLVYKLTEHWALLLNGKLIYNRHRVSENEPTPKAIWQYRNIGTELALEYKYDKFITANVHGGLMFAARLQISDENDRNKHTFRTNAAPYVGTGFDIKF
jgi:hypothetical protein